VNDAQANMEAADKKGFTALLWSAHNGHDGCLRQLLAAKVHSCALRMTARE
jgi:ankyrin repeat protein